MLLLEAKLGFLYRVLSGHPFEFSRTIIYPRGHLGIPGMDEETEHEESISVERVAIDNARMALNVADRDLKDIENDIVTLRVASDMFLKCLLCSNYMKTPLFVDRCNHAFCQTCLVRYLQQQRHLSVSYRHCCPARDCEQLILQAPRPIPIVSALAEAIYFATCDSNGTKNSAKEWCSDKQPTFEGLFP